MSVQSVDSAVKSASSVTSWAVRRSRLVKGRAVLSALTLVAASLTAVVTTTLLGGSPALADAVPPAPAGWTTVFGDNFAGPAGSAPAAANWFYDIGTGFGTGEKEQTTNSTNNVYLDGNGHLVLKAINTGGTWTSARIESTREDFQAPPGGKLEMTASIQQPNPANGLGYWPAFWMLGSPMRAGGGWPTSGELDVMEDVNGLNQASQTLHDAANSPGHGLIACPGAGSSCQTGYHTYSVIVDRTNTSAEFLQFLMDDVVESTITEASVGVTAWQQAIDHGFFIIWDLAMGGNYPDGISGVTTPTAATTSGGSMSVAYVAVYEQGGNSTPTATATATGTVRGINALCLANQNSLNVAGTAIGLGGCNGSAGQQWSPYTDGTMRVQGGCLDVVSAGTTSGTNVDWYPCNTTAAQNWTHPANGELVNPSSGLCLTDPGGNTAARLDIETCTGSAQQLWTLPTGTGTGNTVTVTAPGPVTSTAGTATTLQLSATDSASGQTLSYSASGLPAGLSINAGSGLISGTPSTAGPSTVTVTATDTTGASGSTTFAWTVTAATGTCGTANVALNKPATASSTENAGTPAGSAVDGNAGTRWSSAFSDPQWIQVDLGTVQPICQVTLNWETAYARAFQLQTSTDGTTWTSIYSTTTAAGGMQALNVTGSGRFVRMTGTVRATLFGYSLWEFGVHVGSAGNTVAVANPGTITSTIGTAASVQINATNSASGQTLLTYSATGLPAGLSINAGTGLISGTPTTAGTFTAAITVRDTTGATGTTSLRWTVNPTGGCGTTNLALNRTATASSQQNIAFPPQNAVDGNAGTRWSSASSDPQWIQIDLGATHSVCLVVLSWEAAYATAFQVQTSPDGTTWTSIYSTTTGAGGTQTLNVTGSGRYIRMYGTARATQFGYSLLEFQVIGA